jgi:hypothetical protein
MGMRKAAVFPEPVTALPRISRPSRASGMDLAWIGVGVERFNAVNARRRGRERLISLKEEGRVGSISLF